MARKLSFGSLRSTFQYAGQHPVIGEKVPEARPKLVKPQSSIKTQWLGKKVRCPNCSCSFLIDGKTTAFEYGVGCIDCKQHIVIC